LILRADTFFAAMKLSLCGEVAVSAWLLCFAIIGD